MRLVLVVPVVVLAVSGCIAGSTDASFRPAVIPKLSELPADRERRDAVLDSANVTSGPEQESLPPHERLDKKERRAAGAAAFAAAVLGTLYSTTENVTLGGATTIEETELFTPSRPAAGAGPGAAPPAPSDEPAPDPGTLVPWVKFDRNE